jgi:hypothetical protein
LATGNHESIVDRKFNCHSVVINGPPCPKQAGVKAGQVLLSFGNKEKPLCPLLFAFGFLIGFYFLRKIMGIFWHYQNLLYFCSPQIKIKESKQCTQ